LKCEENLDLNLFSVHHDVGLSHIGWV